MLYQFTKHYSRDEARALLPEVRQWLAKIHQLRRNLDKSEKRLDSLMGEGNDIGGQVVNQWVRTLADVNELLDEFRQREIQIKDLDRGLIDFPAIVGGREVFLCWEDGEDDIEYWHDLDAGYAGREKL
jgi:hypothetical protein